MRPDEIRQNRLYEDLAWLWPLVSPPDDYMAEGEVWRELLRDRLDPGRHRILELGTGGGNLLSQLVSEFDAEAVDLSDGMLEHSRRLNPGAVHHVGDMRSIRLHKIFDAVLIHDAIGYLLTEDDIRRTFETAAAHLRPGGILIGAPDWFAETFEDPCVESATNEADGIEVTYIAYEYDPDPDDFSMETLMVYMIRENGQLLIEHDRHIHGLFPLNTWLELMEQAGFKAGRYDCDTNGEPRQCRMLVGTLRA